MTDLTGVTTAPGEQQPQQPQQPVSASPSQPSILPPLHEEVETSIRKEGISFVFESRSVSAVVQFIYTPIDGTFADIELEVNNGNPLKPAAGGGIAVEMGGSVWPPDSEEVERHLISCEQVGDCVEARWQWKLGEEQANFLYRFRISGKSLVVAIEGGHGKGTGLSLGRVTGALHPRLIAIPYFNLGDHYPRILCTAGYFLSSFVDWHGSHASSLYAPPEAESQRLVQLNGGCTYASPSSGKRSDLQEHWLITVSTQHEEVLPTFSAAGDGQSETLADWAWYNIPYIDATQESYVELYESMRQLKLMGVDHLLINHPSETWHDGDGNATLAVEGAAAKGGQDALGEYLEALSDLGYKTSLQVSYRHIAPTNPCWRPEWAAQLANGAPTPTGPGLYLFKPSEALAHAPEHARTITAKYPCDALYVSEHAEVPPWEFNDFGGDAATTGHLVNSYSLQQRVLRSQAQAGLAIGSGGNHWFYAGVLTGYLARMVGTNPSRIPPLVDFDLHHLHTVETDAGVGTIDQYFAGHIPQGEKHSRSPYLARYLAATAAFGHACLLPDQLEWGVASTVKAYYMLRALQKHYLRVPVRSIDYYHNDQFLATNDALLSGAFVQGQVRVTYHNGLEVYANLGWDQPWTVHRSEGAYHLPPGSFCAWKDESLLVYSADAGAGPIDYAACEDYLFVDTRGQRGQFGPVELNGAVVIKERKWEIDVVPFGCQADIVIDVGQYWPDRKLPRLRLLAFKSEDEEPDIYRADMEGDRVCFKPLEDVVVYRIALPEWMVEPGR